MDKKKYYFVGLLLAVFFVISFLTNILGPLIPDIIHSFSLSLTMAAFLPFSFFIAYGVMSIPSGIMVEKYGEKSVMIISFLMAFIGAFMFALFPYYHIAIVSLFIIGSGMAMLQVAINPLLRTAGGEKHFAFNSVLAQLVFGAASFLSPQVYSYFVVKLSGSEEQMCPASTALSNVVPMKLPWVSMYWIFAVISLAMVIILYISKFPKVELQEDEKAGAWEVHKYLLKNKIVILYALAIFAYVGTEQGVANWISKYLEDYHGLNPQVEGANTVSYFWGLITAGCLLGLFLLKLFDSKKVLVGFSFAAIAALLIGLFGDSSTAIIAFPLVGFSISVMWSIIFSLALNSVKKNHGSFSGILVTGIIGGAIVPVVIGSVGDLVGLKFGMLVLLIPLGYITSIGFWAKPIITNETILNK